MNRQILRNVVVSGLFLVPFIPFLVSGSLFFPFITTKAYVWRIIVEIIFAAWVLLAYMDPVYRPRKSWVTYALLIFIIVIGLADAFGVAPVKSFWSNSERMEGFISLLHLGMYFLVVRNVFTPGLWKRWWNTSLVASFFMVVYCLFQLAGVLEIHQGGARVDGTLGNAAYLAVYMLIHIFIALYFLVREKSGGWRVMYGILALLDTLILYHTATRGAILGLLGGLLVTSVWILWKRDENLRARKYAKGYLAVFVIIVLGFFAFRHSSFVTSSPTLERFASINASELTSEGRSYIWPMALKGVLERPILGWGQDNFNYIFNQYYSPKMYALEPWFDRAHNIFLDWATQGGILGLLAYLSLYYVLLRALYKSTMFSNTDKAIITGLIAAYFFHNIFVFDHLISYILFISLLAFVDMHLEAPVLGAEKVYEEGSVGTIGGPVALVALAIVMYFVNIRPILANTALIDGLQSLQASDAAGAATGLEKAYAEARLGRPEVVEQIASNAPQILSSTNLTMAEKNAFFAFALQAVEGQAQNLPTDARYQLLAGTFLESTGHFDEALTYLNRAHELSPGKQQIYFEIASAYINEGQTAKGLDTLKHAYQLDTADTDAEVAYLVGAIYAGDRGTEAALKADLAEKSPASLNDSRITSAYVSAGRFGEVVATFQGLLVQNPNDPQNYINLAAAELKAGDKQSAIATLEKLGTTLPQYKSAADSYIAQIQNGTIK